MRSFWIEACTQIGRLMLFFQSRRMLSNGAKPLPPGSLIAPSAGLKIEAHVKLIKKQKQNTPGDPTPGHDVESSSGAAYRHGCARSMPLLVGRGLTNRDCLPLADSATATESAPID